MNTIAAHDHSTLAMCRFDSDLDQPGKELRASFHTIEICAGVGMLGEGLRAGLARMGIDTRVCCYLEREAYPAAVLAARMQDGALDAAPVWSDILTFDAGAWLGAVDCVVAGFPCQDLSLAGRRAGLDGKRSGLFFDILDIAHTCGARYLFLENVAGIATATATVVDEAEGELEERAAARVLGELADRGWNAEWLTLSASDVGASHGRARWFCWAWRQLDNADGDGSPEGSHGRRSDGAGTDPGERREGAGERRSILADSQRAERRSLSVCGTGGEQRHDGGRRETHGGPGVSDEVLGHTGLQHQHLQQREDGAEYPPASRRMADPERHGRHQGRPEPGREQGRKQCRTCTDHRGGRKHMDQLSNFVAHSSHLAQPTPDGPPSCASGPDSPQPSTKRLNPAFGEWLMGWPIGHTIAEPSASSASETASWRFALQQQLCNLLDE